MPYYGVKAGRQPGVYITWNEAKAQITGFSGAIFKSFPTRELAQAFVGAAVTAAPTAYQLWTDGSALFGQNAGYAYVLVKDGVVLHQGGGKIIEGPFDSYQAELWGVVEGLHYFYSAFGLTETRPSLDVYTDNAAVVTTINSYAPTWSDLDFNTKLYGSTYRNLLAFVASWDAPIRFHHVMSHTGLVFNEQADKLADYYRTAK